MKGRKCASMIVVPGAAPSAARPSVTSISAADGSALASICGTKAPRSTLPAMKAIREPPATRVIDSCMGSM